MIYFACLLGEIRCWLRQEHAPNFLSVWLPVSTLFWSSHLSRGLSPSRHCGSPVFTQHEKNPPWPLPNPPGLEICVLMITACWFPIRGPWNIQLSHREMLNHQTTSLLTEKCTPWSLVLWTDHSPPIMSQASDDNVREPNYDCRIFKSVAVEAIRKGSNDSGPKLLFRIVAASCVTFC